MEGLSQHPAQGTRVTLNKCYYYSIITIIGEPGNQTIDHIKNAFYPPLF